MQTALVTGATSGIGYATVWQFAQSPRRRKLTAPLLVAFAVAEGISLAISYWLSD